MTFNPFAKKAGRRPRCHLSQAEPFQEGSEVKYWSVTVRFMAVFFHGDEVNRWIPATILNKNEVPFTRRSFELINTPGWHLSFGLEEARSTVARHQLGLPQLKRFRQHLRWPEEALPSPS